MSVIYTEALFILYMLRAQNQQLVCLFVCSTIRKVLPREPTTRYCVYKCPGRARFDVQTETFEKYLCHEPVYINLTPHRLPPASIHLFTCEYKAWKVSWGVKSLHQSADSLPSLYYLSLPGHVPLCTFELKGLSFNQIRLFAHKQDIFYNITNIIFSDF